jgi:hypothetical protein
VLAVSIALTFGVLPTTYPPAFAEAADVAFDTDAARAARAPGSPVGPPKKIIICHKGKNTISVSENALPAHLAHGDTLGPCPEDVVICHKNGNTLTVSQNAVPAHLAHGDTLGPCPNNVFMCNNLNNTIIVKDANVAEHLARGHRLGVCPDIALICDRGKRTIRVPRTKMAEFLARPGSYEGYCAGAQGPLISSNQIPYAVSAAN